MRFLLFFIMTTCLLACNKPNPTPELADEIYLDLQSQAQNTAKDVETEKKKLEGFKKELETATPQTGAIKYAQKHYFESEAKVQKLEQLAKYYELKAADRKRYTKTEYMKAFQDGKPWPNPEEVESYKKYAELSRNPASWDSRKRVATYEKESGFGSSAKAGEKAEKGEKKAEPKPAE
jgi:hypothetical protein